MSAAPSFEENCASVPCSDWRSLDSRRGGYAHWHCIWNEGNHGAGDHDPNPHPDPHHQRIQMDLKNGTASILVQSLVHKVQIFFEGGSIGDHGGHLLAGFVEAPLRIQGVNLFSAFEYIDDGPLTAVIRFVFLSVRAAHQGVSPETHFVAVTHFLLFILIESSAGETDHDDDHAEVNDVTTITPGIAMRELHHRGEKALTRMSFDDSAAADELRDHGEPHQCRQHDRHYGVEIRHVFQVTNSD